MLEAKRYDLLEYHPSMFAEQWGSQLSALITSPDIQKGLSVALPLRDGIAELVPAALFGPKYGAAISTKNIPPSVIKALTGTENLNEEQKIRLMFYEERDFFTLDLDSPLVLETKTQGVLISLTFKKSRDEEHPLRRVSFGKFEKAEGSHSYREARFILENNDRGRITDLAMVYDERTKSVLDEEDNLIKTITTGDLFSYTRKPKRIFIEMIKKDRDSNKIKSYKFYKNYNAFTAYKIGLPIPDDNELRISKNKKLIIPDNITGPRNDSLIELPQKHSIICRST